LKIDLQQRRTTRCKRLHDRRQRRAVPLHTMHDGPFQQRAVSDQCIELVIRDEVVMHPVDLAGAR
jgi:hypothetical protein